MGRIEWERMTSADLAFHVMRLRQLEAAAVEQVDAIRRLAPGLARRLDEVPPRAGEAAVDVIVSQYLYGAPVLPLWQPLTPPYDGRRAG